MRRWKVKKNTLHLGQHHLMSLCAFRNIQILHFLDETNIDVGNFTHEAAISSVSFTIFKFHSCGKLIIYLIKILIPAKKLKISNFSMGGLLSFLFVFIFEIKPIFCKWNFRCSKKLFQHLRGKALTHLKWLS